MLDPNFYRCSSRDLSNHSPLGLIGLEKARFRAILRMRLGVRIPELLPDSLSDWRILSEGLGVGRFNTQGLTDWKI